MTGIVSSLDTLPVWIKAGWAMLFAWSLLQLVWYRRGRMSPSPLDQMVAATPRPPSRAEPRIERPTAIVPDNSTAPRSVLGLT